MSEVKHTPIPWQFSTCEEHADRPDCELVSCRKFRDRHGEEVVMNKANSDFVLTAVNSHAELMAEVKLFADIARLESPRTQLGGWNWKWIHERLSALLASIEGLK